MIARVETLDALADVAVHAVLVDRIGMAYQVVQLGSDTSFAKSGADTRRSGFVQAGNHVTYALYQMARVLPLRVVDDGSPEPVEVPA